MLEFHIQLLLLGNACHMHQTGTVGTRDESRTSLHVTLHLVKSHLGTHGRLFDCSCLMHMAGVAKKQGLNVEFKHVVEILAAGL